MAIYVNKILNNLMDTATYLSLIMKIVCISDINIYLFFLVQADNEYIRGNSAKCKRLGKIVRVISILSILLTLTIIVVVSIVFNI